MVKIPKLDYTHVGEAEEEQIQQLSRLTLPWAILHLDIYPANILVQVQNVTHNTQGYLMGLSL